MGIFKTSVLAAIAFFSFVSAALSETAATSEHNFEGVWITSDEFANIPKTDVFHRQLDRKRAAEVAAAAKIKNRHVLFRKTFELVDIPKNAKLFFSADDYAKIYINGNFVVQRRHEQYRYVFVGLAHPFGKFEAVRSRHHDVRDQHIEILILHGCQSLVPVMARGYFVSVVGQRSANQTPQRAVVFRQ